MHSVVVLADDLTGATDTVHGFAARGFRATVHAVAGQDAKPVAVDRSTVVGFNTASRYVDERVAAETVAGILGAVSALTVYKKVDSTLRGNVAAEVDAALESTGADLALVAPAFPATGRTTAGGVHYVDDTPVAETSYGADETGPASSSLPDLFAAVDRTIETVPTHDVAAGRDRLVSTLDDVAGRDDHSPVVVCDAETDEHLAAVAAAGAAFDTLYVGSGGLAAHVPVPSIRTEPAPLPAAPSGPPLGVVGSVNGVTLEQLDRVPGEAVVELDATDLLDREPDCDVAGRAARRLRNGEPTVLTAATDRGAVDRTVATGRSRGLARGEIGERVADGLAEIAGRITARELPGCLVVTGGDVAVALVRALDATTVAMTGNSVTDGVPIGRFVDGVAAGTPFVTKAGGFGDPETIVNCLDEYTGADD